MMKTFKRMFLALLLAVILCAGGQPAFAYVDEGKVQEQNDSESQSDTEAQAEQAADSTVQNENSGETETQEKESGVLTPEGELSLADDLTDEAAENLQFMTVQTRDGSVFYLIIDRSSPSENVYFLNQVDASDLLAIMNDKEVDAYEESLKKQEESESKVILPEPEEVKEQEQEPEPAETYADDQNEKKDEKKSGKSIPLPLMVLLGVIAAGILGGYYFFKIRPERNGTNIDRMEFEDDEYIDDGPVEPDE